MEFGSWVAGGRGFFIEEKDLELWSHTGTLPLPGPGLPTAPPSSVAGRASVLGLWLEAPHAQDHFGQLPLPSLLSSDILGSC